MCPVIHHVPFTRLNLTPTPREKRTRSRTQTSSEQVTKKPRLDPQPTETKQSAISASAAGCLQICDVDPSGRFVKINNLSSEVCTVAVNKTLTLPFRCAKTERKYSYYAVETFSNSTVYTTLSNSCQLYNHKPLIG